MVVFGIKLLPTNIMLYAYSIADLTTDRKTELVFTGTPIVSSLKVQLAVLLWSFWLLLTVTLTGILISMLRLLGIVHIIFHLLFHVILSFRGNISNPLISLNSSFHLLSTLVPDFLKQPYDSLHLIVCTPPVSQGMVPDAVSMCRVVFSARVRDFGRMCLHAKDIHTYRGPKIAK